MGSEMARWLRPSHCIRFWECDAAITEVVQGEELLLLGWRPPSAGEPAVADANTFETNTKGWCRNSGIPFSMLHLMFPGVIFNSDVLIDRPLHLFKSVQVTN